MSFTGWMCFGGTEIVNNDRTVAYANNGWAPKGVTVRGCDTCGPEMAAALGQEGGVYSTPGTDNAPWFSTTEPNSNDFAGLLVTSVTGLGPGVVTRETTARASGRGSFFGVGRQASPVIVVRGVLIARTCCGASFGLRWLSRELQTVCDDGCTGNDLTYVDCCPDLCDEQEDFVSYEECLAPYLRTLKGVQLISSPVVVEQLGSGCNSCGCGGCPLSIVEFTLSAADPCVFREPVLVAEDLTFADQPEGPCPEWIAVAPGTDCSAGPCDDVVTDCATSVCATPPKPPTPPTSLNPCVCTPMTTKQTCVNFGTSTIPEFAAGVPIVEIDSGNTEMRQVRIRFWVNPLALPVSELDECDACGEVTLAGIPQSSVFRMDGTTNTVTIQCPGSDPTDATPLLGSTSGRLPFRFPEIPCGGVNMTMCIEAENESVETSTASADVWLAVREC